MLIHPYQEKSRLASIPGTRLLQDTLGLLGAQVGDPLEPRRTWRVCAVYAPVLGRTLGGIRVKLEDTKGFVSFCNQRDLEVLLGLGSAGNWCRWAGHNYVEPGDKDWFGLCCDDEDLLDDLHDRELLLRAVTPGGVLAPPQELSRRVHLDTRHDVEDLFVFLWDYDQETGLFPDPRFETIEKRWIRAQREKVRWERL